MIDRRTFVRTGWIGLTVAGCAAARPESSDDNPVQAALNLTSANLSSSVMEDALRYARDLEPMQRTVLERNVSYDVAPRFFRTSS